MRRGLRVVTKEKLSTTTSKEKQTNGKGGGTQGLSLIDGDVPLCIRSREAMINEPKKVKGSSKEANEGSGSKRKNKKRSEK